MSALDLYEPIESVTCDTQTITESQAAYARLRRASVSTSASKLVGPSVDIPGDDLFEGIHYPGWLTPLGELMIFPDTQLSRTEIRRRARPLKAAPPLPTAIECPPLDPSLVAFDPDTLPAQPAAGAAGLGTLAKSPTTISLLQMGVPLSVLERAAKLRDEPPALVSSLDRVNSKLGRDWQRPIPCATQWRDDYTLTPLEGAMKAGAIWPEGEDFTPTDPARRRFAMQTAAAALMPQERVSHCLRHVTSLASNVEVIHVPASGSACYSGLQTCGSVWMCPVCAAKVSERRRQELGEAIRAWEAAGGAVVMITYTVRHSAKMQLKAVRQGLAKAREKMMEGGPWERFKRRFRVAGTVRALEVTYGANGWHPHYHEIMFIEPGPAYVDKRGKTWSFDGGDFVTTVKSRWRGAVDRAGLKSVNDHGCDVVLANNAIADYIAKWGTEKKWRPEHELTKQVSKVGARDGNRTPMQLLSDYAFRGDVAAGEIWQEYARGMRGQRQLYWSPGLRDRLGLGRELTDDEEAARVEQQGVVLAFLTLPEWRVIVANDSRVELLAVARTGDAAAVAAFVADLMADCIPIRDIMGPGASTGFYPPGS